MIEKVTKFQVFQICFDKQTQSGDFGKCFRSNAPENDINKKIN